MTFKSRSFIHLVFLLAGLTMADIFLWRIDSARQAAGGSHMHVVPTKRNEESGDDMQKKFVWVPVVRPEQRANEREKQNICINVLDLPQVTHLPL